MMKHHTFSPSKLDQLRLCPGSHYMQLGLPEPSASSAAEEGTLLHERVAQRSTDGLDDIQADLVESCWNFLDATAQGDGDEVLQEQKLGVDNAQGDQVTFGTVDAIIRHSNGTLSVIDWKFGYRPVNDVANNAQLAAYCAAAMQHFGANECNGYIYQPRLKNTSHFKYTNRQAIVQFIEGVIGQATGEKMILNPGEDQCRYCRARLGCPAFRVKYQQFAALAAEKYEDERILAELYDESKQIKTYIAQVEDAVKEMIEKTGRCDRYVFATSEGYRQIPDLNALYDRIRDLITPREFNEICSVSVTKLDSLLSSKIQAASEEKMSKAAAKKEASEMVADLITRGTPTRRIVEAKAEQ
jgi:RecB family exonuclease